MDKSTCSCEEGEVMRKGPWTWEEDLLLTNYISAHGESVWNSLARSAGLKRTGKSCRLRWLNYLRPDLRRGNITPQEQLLILDLHSKLGNRWSKIAKHLPGRTDNEIKNFWRTRIQKHMKQEERFTGQSYECKEEANKSKMCNATYDTLEDLSSPAYSYQQSGPFLTQLNDSNFWSMEDPCSL